MDILSGIQMAVQGLKTAKDISDRWNDLQVRQLLTTSIEQVLDVKESALGLKQRILELTEENMKLKEELKEWNQKQVEKVVHKPPFFYKEGEEKPLCPRCWQEKQKTIYLIAEPWNGAFRHDCPICKFENFPPSNPTSRTIRRTV